MRNRHWFLQEASTGVSQEFQLYVAVDHVLGSQLPFGNGSVTVRNEGVWPFSGNRNLTPMTNVIL
jgi:hypothetical protein